MRTWIRGWAAGMLGMALAGPALAQAAEGVMLATVTCAEARREGAPVGLRFIVPAIAGRNAALAGHARLSADYVKAVGEAVTRGCSGPEGAGRKVNDIAAGVAMPPKGAKDHDFAAMTCTQLGPIWKEEARQIVPFLFGLREGGAATPMTRAALDRIGDGLPKLCRETLNANRRVADVARELK